MKLAYSQPIAFLVILFLLISCRSAPCLTCPPNGSDTTSHNFTWTTQMIGVTGLLRDVAIINDTLAYAVGEMYLNDSTGKIDPILYNLATWNGNNWSIRRVPYYYQGQPFYSPIYSIFAFNSNDIWFEAGIHWNGQQSNSIPLSIDFPSHINKMWGTSSNDLYIVGNNGLLAHRNADGRWTKLSSGTTLPIADIWGARTLLGQWEILAVAGDPLNSYDRRILRIEGSSVTTLSDNGINWALSGVWFLPGIHYYCVGSGVYEKRSLNDPQWANGPLDITTFYINAVRGTSANDVYAVGAYGEFLHYNGATWRSFKAQTGLQYGQYYSVAVSGDNIFAVGEESLQAVVVQGRHLK